MGGSDRLHDGQAESEALVILGYGAAPEPLEDDWFVLVAHTSPRVPDPQP